MTQTRSDRVPRGPAATVVVRDRALHRITLCKAGAPTGASPR